MPDKKKWEGRSRGGLTGHRIFVFILRVFGLRVAYFFLRFVAFYFFVFASSTKSSLRYFRRIHHYEGLRLYRAVYRNYFLFGQTLLDKVALLSGLPVNITMEHEGRLENLRTIKDTGRGAILLSAHIGNWEVAGEMLDGLDKVFNILMYDNEAKLTKAYMDQVMAKRSFRVIPIRDDDMSHLVELHKAFSNNELVVMHGDRYLPGTEVIEKTFMGHKARFPVGPFVLASKFAVPIILVFAAKETHTHYHLFAFKPIEVKRARGRQEVEAAVAAASDAYVHILETMVKRYPEQWFNFYDFWDLK